jgi:soluble lytic murein transglycosylase-like protein
LTTLFGHSLVLSLGLLLVATAWSTGAMARPGSAHETSDSLVAFSPIAAGNAADLYTPTKPEQLEPTPTPPPAPTPAPPPAAPLKAAAPVQGGTFAPPPGSGGNGLAAIYAVFGNSPGLSWALRVANCESHYNPLAVNRSSGASGLFQFMPSTWNANFPGQNIWDPMAQAHGALVFYNAGRQSAWTCK